MKYIYIIILIFSLHSCTTEEFSERILQRDSDIELQPRSPSLPPVTDRPLVKNVSRSIGPNGEQIINSHACLGYSYTVGNAILGDPENIRFQIIDVEKAKSKDPSMVSGIRIGKSDDTRYTYDDMESYGDVLTKTNKIVSGFSLHIGKFKLGRKKTLTKFFKDSLTSTTKSIMGELNIILSNNSFRLSMGESDIKKYFESCMSKSFLENLYSTTINNISLNYGEFVLTGYVTGGKAMAFYAGLHKDSTALSIKTKDLNTDINASFAWNNTTQKDSIKGSLIFGKTNGSKKEFSGNLTQTQIRLNTYGGKLSNQILASTANLEDVSIDLTSWWESLSDHDTHTMVDISEQGLYPLYTVILEKNFKQRMKDTEEGYLYGFNNMCTPYMEIVRVFARYSSGQPLYEVAAVLNTRNGDKIVLSDGKYLVAADAELRQNDDDSMYDLKVQELLNKFRRFFPDLRFVKNYSTRYNPDVRDPLCIRLDGFDGDNLLRHVEDNGMVYLYNRKARFALSYYSDDGLEDKTMDDYGMWDWYDAIPDEGNRRIQMMTLIGYTIIGL